MKKGVFVHCSLSIRAMKSALLGPKTATNIFEIPNPNVPAQENVQSPGPLNWMFEAWSFSGCWSLELDV